MATIGKDANGDRFETRKFPGGYTVRVVRKEDILATIDANITDKDVVLDVIKHCELSAANYISSGQWATVPYMGSFKLNLKRMKVKKQLAEFSEGVEGLIDKHDDQERARYYLFKKQISEEAGRKIKQESAYNYIVALGVTKHAVEYNRVYRKLGKFAARLYIYFLMNVTAIDNRYEYEYSDALIQLENDKQQATD